MKKIFLLFLAGLILGCVCMSLGISATENVVNVSDGGEVAYKVPNKVFEYGTFVASNGISLPYRYYFPDNYDDSVKSYPFYIYLHGNGSRGNDNVTHIASSSASIYSEVLNSEYECIMIAPQCAKSPHAWVANSAGSAGFVEELEAGVYGNGEYLNAAIELFDYFINTYRIDTTRIYLTGASNGGAASWSLAARYPYVFAATVPLAGCNAYDGTEPIAPLYVHQNIWTFHGDMDPTVSVDATRALVSAIKAVGGEKIIYTEIAGGTHNIWTKAAQTEGLIDWMFSKTNTVFTNTLRGERKVLATPLDLIWNGSKATFNKVSGAKAYRLTVYVNNVATKVYELTNTEQEIDIDSLGAGDITFGVVALAKDLSLNVNSAEAKSAVYFDDVNDGMDYDCNGTVNVSDVVKMVEDGASRGTFNLFGILRIIKHIIFQ